MRIDGFVVCAALAAMVGLGATGCSDECGPLNMSCNPNDLGPTSTPPELVPLDLRLPPGTLPPADEGDPVAVAFTDEGTSPPSRYGCVATTVSAGGFDLSSGSQGAVAVGGSYRIDWFVDQDGNAVFDSAADLAFAKFFSLAPTHQGPELVDLSTSTLLSSSAASAAWSGGGC